MAVAVKAPRRASGLVPLDDQTTALIYTRVSTDEQAEEGVSLSAQVAECRRYVSRQGWVFGDEMQDVETGRRDDRPEYQRLLLTVRGLALQGTTATVVVASLDRLGRNLLERVRVHKELTKLSVEIHSVREGGVVNPLTYHILASVAEEESRKLGERVRASGRHFVEQGWHPVGRVAWGYQWRPATDEERKQGAPLKVLEPHPVEAAYMREAWERLARGESMHAIARWAAALPREARGGRNLRYAAIRLLFRSPVYVARFGEMDDDVLARPVGRWEPLISDDTWQAAQERQALARRMPRQASGAFPLTGLLRCHRCGGRMGGRTNRAKWQPKRPVPATTYPIREYVCTAWAEGADGAQAGGPKCVATVPARAVEHAVLTTVGELLAAVDRPKVREHARKAWAERERAVKADDDVRRIADLDQQLRTARRRISAASVKFLDGDLDREAYDIVRADLAADLEAAEAELTRLRGRARPAALPPLDAVLAGVGGWAKAMKTAAPAPVRHALGVLIERAEPVRVGYGKYEARLDWTPIGWSLLGAAIRIAPSENLLQVEHFAHP